MKPIWKPIGTHKDIAISAPVFCLFHESGEEGMVLQAKEAREWNISVYNCLGEVVCARRQALKGLEEIKVPKSGMIRLEAAQ